MIRFRCQKCSQTFKVAAKFAGKKLRCTKCDAVLRIPQTVSDSPSANLKTSPSVPQDAFSTAAADELPAAPRRGQKATSAEASSGHAIAGDDVFGDLPAFQELEQDVPSANANLFADEMASSLPTAGAQDELDENSPQNVVDEAALPVDLADAISNAEQLIQSDVMRQAKRDAYESGAKLTPAQIKSSFSQNPQPPERSSGFGDSLRAVATKMMVLPIVFALGVLLGTAGVIIVAVSYIADPPQNLPNPFLFFGFAVACLLLISSWTPIFSMAGALWSLFFKKQVERPGTRTVTRKQQPALYGFVDEICSQLNAPAPCRIDLDCNYNASASFRDGWKRSGKEEYVLTIGVPLIASHSAEQLASVIAHEFGHFCQTKAMRTHYVIRHIIAWFMQAAYVKTINAEITMYESSNSEEGTGLYVIPYYVGWFGRKLLWWFGYLGHKVSGGLSREMEYDADRYAVHLAGSKNFQRSMIAVEKHAVAHSVTVENLKMLFLDHQVLVNNIPRFMMHVAKTMPGATVRRLADEIEQQKQEAFDTHPPTRERIEAATKLARPGMLKMARPATDLIVSWQDLCEVMTIEFYRSVTGLDVQRSGLTRLEDVLKAEHRLLLDKE